MELFVVSEQVSDCELVSDLVFLYIPAIFYFSHFLLISTSDNELISQQ